MPVEVIFWSHLDVQNGYRTEDRTMLAQRLCLRPGGRRRWAKFTCTLLSVSVSVSAHDEHKECPCGAAFLLRL